MTKFRDIVEKAFKSPNMSDLLGVTDETIESLVNEWENKVKVGDLDVLKEKTIEEAEVSENIHRHYRVNIVLKHVRGFLNHYIDGKNPLPYNKSIDGTLIAKGNSIFPNIIVKKKKPDEDAHGIYDINTNTVYLCLLDDQNKLTEDGTNYTFERLNTRLRRTLSHEMRHFYDIWLKHRKEVLPDPNITSPEKAKLYFNNPYEIDAYTDELSEAVYQFLIDNWYYIEDEFDGKIDKTPITKEYIKLIDKAIDIAIDEITKEKSNLSLFLKYLTPENKQKVLKTIASWYGKDLCYYFKDWLNKMPRLKAFVKLHKLKK